MLSAEKKTVELDGGNGNVKLQEANMQSQM